MSISARNQLVGVVSGLAHGAVNDEVTLTLSGGERLVAVVTKASREAMGLVAGKSVTALVKAPWVILASGDCGLKFSARNQFAGKVAKVDRGAVNSSVQVQTASGLKLASVVTNEAADEMALAVGCPVVALVKASSVILAVAC